MNMKKMRGAIDPLTLGFIIAAVIAALGANTSASVQQARQNQNNVQQTAVTDASQPPIVRAGYVVQKKGQ